MGMFEETYIDNDIALVDKAICEYYNLKAPPAPSAPPAGNAQPPAASQGSAQAPAGNANGGTA